MKKFLLIVLTAVALQPALVLAETKSSVHSVTRTTTVKETASSNDESAARIARFGAWVKAKAKKAGKGIKSAGTRVVDGCRSAKNRIVRRVKRKRA